MHISGENMKSFRTLFVLCAGLAGGTFSAAGQERTAAVPAGNCANSIVCLENSSSWTANGSESSVLQTQSIQPGTLGAPALSNAPQGSTANQPAAQKLSLHDAEQLALKNHPRITIAELNALASKESVRQVRSAFY